MTKKDGPSSFGSDRAIRAKEAKTVRKIVFFTLLAVIIIIGTGIFFGYSYIKSALGPIDEDSTEQIEVDIPIGSSSSDIAQTLEEQGLIKNSKIFRFYLKFKNYSNFQAGEYILTPSLTLDEIVEELQTGKVFEEPIHKLTIPEGKSIDEIAQIVDEKLNISEKKFLKQVRNEKFITALMEKFPQLIGENILEDEQIKEPLEGYLFATTYDIFEENPSVDNIITMMVEQTNQVLAKRQVEVDDLGFSVHDLLTLASIVERESKFEEDRPKVAQVFLNRLDIDMKLQADITAAYAKGEHKAVMTFEDVAIDSPYNTYVQKGLPPGPIASPSTEAIDAVLQPEGKKFTDLYYFSRPNGETFYSQTLAEHEEIIGKYRQEWYELKEETKNE
jgi:UPF0755 protein